MYTHTLLPANATCLKAKPPSPPIPEVWRDDGDEQTHEYSPPPKHHATSSRWTSPLSPSASKSLCVSPSVWQAPLFPRPATSRSNAPSRRSPWPLTMGHGSFQPTLAMAPCPLASFHSCLTSATADESTSSPTVSTLSWQRFSSSWQPPGNHLWPWVTHRHFTLVLHSSVLWDFTHGAPRSSSSLPFPLQIRSLFIRLCSLPVLLPQGYLTSDHCLIQSFRVPAKAGNFTSLDICLGSSLILPILNLL